MVSIPENVINIRQKRQVPRYNTGDIVMLKSGSPPLTVRYYVSGKGNTSSIVKVDWFNELENLTADFLPDQLMLFDEYFDNEEDSEMEMTAH